MRWNQFQPQMSPANRNTSGIRSPFSSAHPQVPAAKKEVAPFNLAESLESKEVDPQTTSPFYNGRIPAEIRTLIFRYALTESPAPNAMRIPHNPDIHNHHNPVPTATLPISQPFRETHYCATNAETAFYDEPFRTTESGFDWLRPDNTRPVTNHYGLLKTCRRIYLETHHLPLEQKEFVFYGYRGRDGSNYLSDPSTYFSSPHFTNHFSSVAGKKVGEIAPRSVRLFTQLFWLENTIHWVGDRYSYSLGRHVPSTWYNPLVNLRITIRRGDWWDWERDQRLKISPYRRSVNGTGDMERDMVMLETWRKGGWGKRADGRRGVVDDDDDDDQASLFQRNSWGLAFSKMMNLETLVIEFETSEDKKEEMDRIVEWAKKWRFPLMSKEEQQRKRQAMEEKNGDGANESGQMDYHFTQDDSDDEEEEDEDEDDDDEDDDNDPESNDEDQRSPSLPPVPESQRSAQAATSSQIPDVQAPAPAPAPETKRYLSADGLAVQKMSWQAGMGSWSMRCTACPKDRPSADASCDICQERQKLQDNGLGPRLLVWTVTWNAVTADTGVGR